MNNQQQTTTPPPTTTTKPFIHPDSLLAIYHCYLTDRLSRPVPYFVLRFFVFMLMALFILTLLSGLTIHHKFVNQPIHQENCFRNLPSSTIESLLKADLVRLVITDEDFSHTKIRIYEPTTTSVAGSPSTKTFTTIIETSSNLTNAQNNINHYNNDNGNPQNEFNNNALMNKQATPHSKVYKYSFSKGSLSESIYSYVRDSPNKYQFWNQVFSNVTLKLNNYSSSTNMWHRIYQNLTESTHRSNKKYYYNKSNCTSLPQKNSSHTRQNLTNYRQKPKYCQEDKNQIKFQDSERKKTKIQQKTLTTGNQNDIDNNNDDNNNQNDNDNNNNKNQSPLPEEWNLPFLNVLVELVRKLLLIDFWIRNSQVDYYFSTKLGYLFLNPVERHLKGLTRVDVEISSRDPCLINIGSNSFLKRVFYLKPLVFNYFKSFFTGTGFASMSTSDMVYTISNPTDGTNAIPHLLFSILKAIILSLILPAITSLIVREIALPIILTLVAKYITMNVSRQSIITTNVRSLMFALTSVGAHGFLSEIYIERDISLFLMVFCIVAEIAIIIFARNPKTLRYYPVFFFINLFLLNLYLIMFPNYGFSYFFLIAAFSFQIAIIIIFILYIEIPSVLNLSIVHRRPNTFSIPMSQLFGNLETNHRLQSMNSNFERRINQD
ncbi:countin-like protein-related [Anaeramoeba flamelloides]|uniref:Countin-like protein-related n=1 Tax=Anaeramoeba flamelloides TaxID=1746091 RepID=A0ABQ8XLD7_9EUKA|nr:countin-like protein-related [Anaeramoeba flamelloides]